MSVLFLRLHQHGLCRKVDIYENVSWNTNIPKKIILLEELGLLYVDEDDHNPIFLTENGCLVAF